MRIDFCYLSDNSGCFDCWSDAKFVPRTGDTVCLFGGEYIIDEVKWSAPDIVKCIVRRKDL